MTASDSETRAGSVPNIEMVCIMMVRRGETSLRAIICACASTWRMSGVANTLSAMKSNAIKQAEATKKPITRRRPR